MYTSLCTVYSYTKFTLQFPGCQIPSLYMFRNFSYVQLSATLHARMVEDALDPMYATALMDGWETAVSMVRQTFVYFYSS